MLESHCCFCFFDVCLVSYELNDTYPTQFRRVKDCLNKRFEAEKRKGLCGCSLCKPPKYTTIWNVRLYCPTKEYRYFSCLEHVKYSLTDTIIEPFFAKILSNDCSSNIVLRSLAYHDSVDFPSCYYYWKNERLTERDFCGSCKLYLMRNFFLKKISAENNAVFSAAATTTV